jgi:hypothetical protein
LLLVDDRASFPDTAYPFPEFVAYSFVAVPIRTAVALRNKFGILRKERLL